MAMEMAPGVEGMLADIGPKFVNTRANGSGGVIPYGVVVTTMDGARVKLPAAGEYALGITQCGTELVGRAGTTGYPDKTPVAVVEQGTVWVKAENNVTAYSDVFYRVTAAGGNTQLGALRGDADAGNAVLLEGAKFITSAAAGQLAQVRINRPA